MPVLDRIKQCDKSRFEKLSAANFDLSFYWTDDTKAISGTMCCDNKLIIWKQPWRCDHSGFLSKM